LSKTFNSRPASTKDERHIAYIGLGSNLGDPQQHIKNAVVALRSLPQSGRLHCSHYYRSKAIGPGKQPDYINAVVSITTSLPPLTLLRELQSIEHTHGRQRDIRWGARTLDLDLLLYGDHIISSKELQVPHPEIFNRNFVLYPLNDIAPTLVFPNGSHLTQLIKQQTMSDLNRIMINESS